MIEVMKQALEALELEDMACRYEKEPTPEHIAKAIASLRQAIEQAEKQVPVAFDLQKALRRAYHLGQNYWADADSESYSANKRADKHRQDFDALCEEALAYTTPQPNSKWVGLTDEEIDTWNIVGHESLREFVRAIEAKLKERNHVN